MRRPKHRFCAVTGYCEKCGMPKGWFARHDVVVMCYSAENVVSLDWKRRLRAHYQLQSQLVSSVATIMES